MRKKYRYRSSRRVPVCLKFLALIIQILSLMIALIQRPEIQQILQILQILSKHT